jgi:polyphosphate kinase
MAADKPTLELLDRDFSWLEFNRRVLHEAIDPRTPLLERLKFLAIFSSNLDEFVMKRVNRLKAEVEAHTPGLASGEAFRKLTHLRQILVPMLASQANAYTNVIRPELAKNGVRLLAWNELTGPQQQTATAYFRRNVFPVLTPLAVDPTHPFPFLSNLSTSLGVLLRPPDSEERFFARVKVPTVFPQWIQLPDATGPGMDFVRLLDIIRNNLDELFPGMTVVEVMPFRVTRNAEIEMDEDESQENVVKFIEQEIKQRRYERIVRLEYSPPASTTQLPMLAHRLGLNETDIYEMPGELDYTTLFPIAGLDLPELRDKPWTPTTPIGLEEDIDLFAAIRAGDLLVHHPYESFDGSVARFLRNAADDPRVLAIKMTVYRIAAHTPFLDGLVRAAEAGKQVACLVEVTARFDERQNLAVAHALEKAGVHVVYGVMGLKTHAKVALVVRQDDDGLRCYAHIGTGNYHVNTARLYVDLGLLTCDPGVTSDLVELFHFLTGRSSKREYSKLLVAPVTMRDRFLALIDREIEHHRAGRPAAIIGKLNQLQDPAICEALVRASQAGVSIELIVRGFCVLPPGIAGLTDQVKISSVIGRFLEHSRIYHFRNGQADPVEGDFFIGSADWMERNLSHRVEAITPIEARPLRERLWEVLQIMRADQRQAWDMQADGSYVQRTPASTNGPGALGTQQTLMDLTRRIADSRALE